MDYSVTTLLISRKVRSFSFYFSLHSVTPRQDATASKGTKSREDR